MVDRLVGTIKPSRRLNIPPDEVLEILKRQNQFLFDVVPAIQTLNDWILKLEMEWSFKK